jgi:phosphatidate cytidylyltransferase
VEGAGGGAATAMLLSALLAPTLVGLSLFPALVLGAVLAGASILGDLFVSALKRHSGAKDTSRIIPGHGGVMDRFDALVFAAPVAWLGLKLLS